MQPETPIQPKTVLPVTQEQLDQIKRVITTKFGGYVNASDEDVLFRWHQLTADEKRDYLEALNATAEPTASTIEPDPSVAQA